MPQIPLHVMRALGLFRLARDQQVKLSTLNQREISQLYSERICCTFAPLSTLNPLLTPPPTILFNVVFSSSQFLDLFA
jgi:hypothetical protein